jgi:tRNA (cytosine38-C5)-methyltransferase
MSSAILQLLSLSLCAVGTHPLLAAPPPGAAVEFYSGMGGFRSALGLARPSSFRVEASYEINTQANAVYAHNFAPDEALCRSIETLRPAELDGKYDLWMGSPPCQPYCKIGKRLDEHDNRARSFHHLLELLPRLEQPPRFVILENVPAFLGSASRRRLLEALEAADYDCFETTLSPVDAFGLGIPNTRLRYFCLAARREEEDEVEEGGLISDGGGSTDGRKKRRSRSVLFAGKSPSDVAMARGDAPTTTTTTTTIRPLSEFLLRAEDMDAAAEALVEGPLKVSRETMEKYSYVKMDVAHPEATETSTVTKGYGKQFGKSGPVLDVAAWRAHLRRSGTSTITSSGSGSGIGSGGGQPPVAAPATAAHKENLEKSETTASTIPTTTTEMERFRCLNAATDEIRYLAPRELLRLHGYGEAFDFPPHFSPRQASALVGNSITVPLAARLLDLLLPPEA